MSKLTGTGAALDVTVTFCGFGLLRVQLAATPESPTRCSSPSVTTSGTVSFGAMVPCSAPSRVSVYPSTSGEGPSVATLTAMLPLITPQVTVNSTTFGGGSGPVSRNGG